MPSGDIQPMEMIHPCGLIRKRNLAEADESHARSAAHEPSYQLTRVSPHAAERIGGDENVHVSEPWETWEPAIRTSSSADIINLWTGICKEIYRVKSVFRLQKIAQRG